jgi:hypothetical protein
MLRSGEKIKYNEKFYVFKSESKVQYNAARKLVQLFQIEKKINPEKAKDYFIDAEKRYQELIKKFSPDSLELAQVLKSYAGALRLRRDLQKDSEKIQIVLEESIRLLQNYIKTPAFKSSSDSIKKAINDSVTTCYVHLGQLALELDDGTLLEKMIPKLEECLKTSPNVPYEQDLLTFQYHYHLAKGDIKQLEEVTKKTTLLLKENGLNSPTHDRHIAKTALLGIIEIRDKDEQYELFLNMKVHFWNSVEKHLMIPQPEFKRNAINKDLLFACQLKIFQRVNKLSELDHSKALTIREYMVDLANQYYRKGYINKTQLMKKIDKLIAQCIEERSLSFCKSLFPERSPNVSILLTDDFIESEFPKEWARLIQESNKKEVNQSEENKDVNYSDSSVTLFKSKTFEPSKVDDSQNISKIKN